MNKISVALLTAVFCWLSASGELMFSGNASMTDGIISFGNGNGFVQVRDSGKFDVSRGVTVSAAVRLNRRPPITGSGFDADKNIIFQHDIIVSKGNSLVFGRRSDAWVDQMYVNFSNGEKWCVPLRKAAPTPEYGKWAVWAVTVEPHYRREEGRRYSVVTLYLNGEAQYRSEVDGNPEISDAPVIWGKGVGINGQNWALNGDIAEIHWFDRVLSDDEVMQLARNSQLVKIDAPGFTEITPELDEVLTAVERKGCAEVAWLGKRLRLAAVNGLDQQLIIQLLQGELKPVLESADQEEFLRQMPVQKSALQLIDTGDMLALVLTGRGEGVFPILGMREKRSGREIFGKQSFSWSIDGVKSQEKWNCSSWGSWICRRISDGRYQVTWPVSDKLTVSCNFHFSGKRVLCDFAADNRDAELRLEKFNFPVVRVAERREGGGFLVHPCQSGILFPDPVRTTLPAAGWYPCGRLNMQFGAYYDGVSGIYFSPEDPAAGIKEYTIRSRGGDLELMWSNPVAFDVHKSGGNSIACTPEAALELFFGNWFDAAMCYKRFVESKARWNRPRFRETPQWFAENTLWFSHWTFKDEDLSAMPGIMQKLRDFYEMPFGVHWYRWNDPAKGAFPHSFAKEGIDRINARLLAMGVYTKAYIDNRLWSERDGAHRQVDLEFNRFGRHYAVLNADKSMNFERYSSACRDVVMCPGVAAWRDKMTSVTDRVASYGFPMIYHDQVSASRPFACFHTGHGHLLNDPAVWGDGYWQMFEQIAQLQAKYPQLCHDTEDASDAHLPFFDGFMPWRWTDQKQVPLFAAVYAGKTQFTGRSFDHTSVGDEASFMVKCASQLVQGEQIGWFTYGMVIKSPRRIIFSKQMAHLRRMLLSFFNGGTMLKPLDFIIAPELQSTMWGIAAPKAHEVTLPEILHCRFVRKSDGAQMILWVNTAGHRAVAQAVRPQGEFWICSVDGQVRKAGEKAMIELAPYSFEVWTTAPADEAEKIAANLKRISGFTAGTLLAQFGTLTTHDGEVAGLNFDNASGNGVRGEKGMVEITGNGRQTLQYKIKMVLEAGKRYRLHMMMRKCDNGAGYAAIANYSTDRKLKFYGTCGSNIPADGNWHEVTLEFTAGEDYFNCGLFLYNRHSTGTVAIDRISLKEIK
ncbi:MAG: hypothetical protein IKC94_04725 [Lentisphaeria bacterium]|nr:hypothetical protein [Lentisphaeria bacterium]